MSSNRFSDDFKRDAVAQITERGYLPRANVGTTSAASYMSLLSGDAE